MGRPAGRDGGPPRAGTAHGLCPCWECTPHFLFFWAQKKRKRAVHGPKEKKTLLVVAEDFCFNRRARRKFDAWTQGLSSLPTLRAWLGLCGMVPYSAGLLLVELWGRQPSAGRSPVISGTFGRKPVGPGPLTRLSPLNCQGLCLLVRQRCTAHQLI